MAKAKSPELAAVEHQALRLFTEKAYLDHSMYVMLDRTSRESGGGLTPVHRRIIYATTEFRPRA